MMPRLSVLLALILFSGCGPTGPPSTRTSSSQFPTLRQKIDFLQKYVTFRRTYETLDFDVFYQNNGGVPPGPSDWDVRLVATVPAAELDAWVPKGLNRSSRDQEWLKSVPTSLDLSGINEWYGDGRRVIGIDRRRRIVVYRNWAN